MFPVTVLDVSENRRIDAEIIPAHSKNLPDSDSGWNFNWKKLEKQSGAETYILRLVNNNKTEGAIHLKWIENMLFMDVIELAPSNIGHNRKLDWVAGCLIAFACRKSFQLESEYRGYLTFISKTALINWYEKHYGAIRATGQRMYFSPEGSLALIEKYL